MIKSSIRSYTVIELELKEKDIFFFCNSVVEEEGKRRGGSSTARSACPSHSGGGIPWRKAAKVGGLLPHSSMCCIFPIADIFYKRSCKTLEAARTLIAKACKSQLGSVREQGGGNSSRTTQQELENINN